MKVSISREETVCFENENETAIKIIVILNKGVEGMRSVRVPQK